MPTATRSKDELLHAAGRSMPTRWSPALERLKAQGRIGAWGITGIGVPTAVLQALDHDAERPTWSRRSPT